MAIEDSDPRNPPRLIPELTTSGEGNTSVIGVDDLVPREKRRLGDYASYITKVVFKNEYPVAPGSTGLTLTTPNGNPAPISDSTNFAEKTYLITFDGSESGQRARSLFEQTSESGLLDTDTKFEIKKGKSDDEKRTGTEIFREIDVLRGQAEVPRRVEEVLEKNNRFSERKPAYRSGQFEGVENSLGSLIIQPELGQHLPGKFPGKKSGDGSDFTTISFEKLKHFGMMTMLNASGEANIPIPDEDDNNYLEILGRNVSTAIPGIARLGKRVEVTRFDGVKILNQIEPTFKKDIRDATLQGRTILSYGNVNSALAPFMGLVGAASINSAAVLGLTVSAMLRALAATVNFQPGDVQSSVMGPQESASISLDRTLRLGHFERNYRPQNENSGLNIVSTSYPYFDCVERGIELFFIGQINRGDFGSTTNQIQHLHGYYNVIFRNLTRNTSDLILGLIGQFNVGSTDFGKSAYDVDPNFGGTDNVITDLAETALGIIKIVNSSKLLKFMNILAVMGEISYASDTENNTVDGISDDSLLVVGSGDFAGVVTPKISVLHAKSRLTDQFGGKLAWGKSTVKSMYLLPSTLLKGGLDYDAHDNRFAGLGAGVKGFQLGSNRLEAEQVKAMETYLEADYMPFYFHDLRTNEICSFHAFLENVSDQYSVDYSENEGYGRIGKVYTYKNTNRTIDLSFMVVATNEDDFDEMWIGINKLITLLYPQYTSGRAIATGNNSFIQPFSQVIAASPMIRLRLGDIFKSNYNKFNLARIFGIGSPDFRLESEQENSETQANLVREANRVNQIMQANRRSQINGIWAADDFAYLRPNFGGSIRGQQNNYEKVEPIGQPARGLRQANATGRFLHITTPTKIKIVNPNGNIRAGRRGITHPVTFELVNPLNDTQSGLHTCDREALSPDDASLLRAAQEQVRQNSSPTPERTDEISQQAINTFFDENTNPVFKSFESVRGKGLAGFIKTFNMEIDNKFPWETVGINNRAPKMVKITMQFLPVHDLQPGIDSNGFNTAPIYNVGKTNRKINSDTASSDVLDTEERKYFSDTFLDRSRSSS